MPDIPTIAVIIPVYNREVLLPFTLDSILNQSFFDWECILVDDHSTDGSFAVLESYQRKDPRFKAYKRPNELKKGANACRNFGFSKSSAQYIKWFDSDDIMLPNHLELSYRTLVDNHLDYVVADNLNFDHDTNKFLGTIYNFDKDKTNITAENFALNLIGWITDDFLGTRVILENVQFNENITTDGDEYNFFVKLLHHSIKGDFLHEVLTYRRVHNDTLTGQNGENTGNYFNKIANVKFQTAKDLLIYNEVQLIRWFLSGYMRYSFMLVMEKKAVPYKNEAFKLICKYYSLTKGSAFLLALISGSYLKKGYNIMKYARK